jgi:predicted DNA-binding transcriptional regulator YafY
LRRADRLFQIVQLLRTRRVVTAAQLARELEVAPRTIYRDIADLMASGVPIDGEAGVGYALARGFDLPPLTFDPEEIGALVLGARMVQAFGDEGLARCAKSLLAKVESVVPERLRQSFDRPAWQVTNRLRKEVRAHVENLRRAIDERRKLRFRYQDEQGVETERTVRPLCLAFWGPQWTTGAWCELRQAFRNFRPDRMQQVELLAQRFEDEPDKNLTAYLRELEEELRRERSGRTDCPTVTPKVHPGLASASPQPSAAGGSSRGLERG